MHASGVPLRQGGDTSMGCTEMSSACPGPVTGETPGGDTATTHGGCSDGNSTPQLKTALQRADSAVKTKIPKKKQYIREKKKSI